MGPYRQYLLTGKPIPRSTLFRRRQRALKKKEELQKKLSMESGQTHSDEEMRCDFQTLCDETQQTDLEANVCSLKDPVCGSEQESGAADVTTSITNSVNSIMMSTAIQTRKEPQVINEGLADSFVYNQFGTEEVHGDSLSEDEEMQVPPKVTTSSSQEHHYTKCENVDADDGGFPTQRLSNPLCGCVETTVGDAIFMCLSLGLRHNLTWSAQVDILKMLNSIFGQEMLPQNKYAYFSEIHKEDNNISYHIFCSNCDMYLSRRDNTRGTLNCEECNSSIDVSNPSNYFLSLSLEEQFKKLLNNPNVSSLILSHRFNRSKLCDAALEDIYDGDEYRKHSREGGILSSPFNFSYSFFVDGVSTGKSTGKTMWPIYVTINELPFKERTKYIFLAGLYIGPKDPNQLIFLQPFVQEANKLSTEGLNWEHKGKIVSSKIIPLCGVTDSVARWQVLNMQSFHAYYGCTFCYQKQTQTAPKKRRFDLLSDIAPDRTAESTLDDALKAYEKRDEVVLSKRHHKGVKGPSVLTNLLYFNLIWGFTVEYMHAVLLGCVKTHMELLFESSRKYFWIDMTDRVALSNLLSTIDCRLLQINPPNGITRLPRSIADFKLWKASEWRSWIAFYCIPCLEGLLKPKHLAHLALLSKGICTLLQKSVTKEDVQESHNNFMDYCYYFQKYFDQKHTIYNIHLLTHISKCVLNWGPLWTQNAFAYEGQNRHLLQLFKSPNYALTQIAQRYIVYSSIPDLCNELVTSEKALEFSENLLNRQLVQYVQKGESKLLGASSRNVILNEKEEDCLMLFSKYCSRDCIFFKRMLFRKIRLTTSEYADGKKTNNSFVLLKKGFILRINHIALSPTQKVMLLGQRVKVQKRPIFEYQGVTVQHIRKVKREGQYECVPPQDVESICLVMSINNDVFVSPLPFGCLGD